MAQKTECQTPDAVYQIELRPADVETGEHKNKVKTIYVKVTLPKPVILYKDKRNLIRANIHNVLELALKELF